MRAIERLGLLALHRLEPERAHDLSLLALRAGLVPLPRRVESDRLRTTLAGLDLPNPLGLAAGYDKNAVALAPLLRAGFGFVEVGAVTPRPQPGNPRPRLFRLMADRAVINRFGFNNEGAERVARRLARPRPAGVVGLNLGANRDSPDRIADYVAVLGRCGALVDFVTVNVSSPNTRGLRDLQGAEALARLLQAVVSARAALSPAPRVFLKVAPDLDAAAIAEIAAVALDSGIDGIIATNTTTARPALRDPQAGEPGGLSGEPLFRPSTRVLALLHAHTGGRLPLVGVGGIGSAEQAYAKIRAGATALQLYSALVYEGFGLLPRILTGLDRLLEQDGFSHISQAIGIDRDQWT